MGSWKSAVGCQSDRCLRDGRPSNSCELQVNRGLHIPRASWTYIENRANNDLLLVAEALFISDADVPVLDPDRIKCRLGALGSRRVRRHFISEKTLAVLLN